MRIIEPTRNHARRRRSATENQDFLVRQQEQRIRAITSTHRMRWLLPRCFNASVTSHANGRRSIHGIRTLDFPNTVGARLGISALLVRIELRRMGIRCVDRHALL
jgi:hypothetical protein